MLPAQSRPTALIFPFVSGRGELHLAILLNHAPKAMNWSHTDVILRKVKMARH
jgi:hypothetical protein